MNQTRNGTTKHVRLDPIIHKRLKFFSDRTGISATEFAGECIKDGLEAFASRNFEMPRILLLAQSVSKSLN